MARKTNTKTRKTHGHIPTDDTKVFDILRATNGNVNQASERLDINPATLHIWLTDDPGRRDILRDIRAHHDDALIDKAITALERNLDNTDGRVSNKATDITFRYMGKRRGYVPASQVEADNTNNVRIEVIRGGDDNSL